MFAPIDFRNSVDTVHTTPLGIIVIWWKQHDKTEGVVRNYQ